MPKSQPRKPNGDSLTVNGSPTKDFFIHMLTRDIELTDAIVDLVDNSVDGARRLRGTKSLKGLRVDITVSPDRFLITDNCGGIPEADAAEYAFRFGRPPGAKPLRRSVGQFGVGMKRALFKIGAAFEIRSTHAKFAFRLPVSVEEWSADPDTWEFVLRDAKRPANGKKFAQAKQGTEIEVWDLDAEVSPYFGLEDFHGELRRAIGDAHIYNMSRGLRIRVNGQRCKSPALHMLESSELAPAFRSFSVLDGKVDVSLYAGLARAPSARDDTHQAGWYIFCNNRLVLGADKTDVTGWLGRGADVPRYHAEYRYFRGYAFFEADDPGLLPWTTTKSGVDVSNAGYRQARIQMEEMMQPVIGFLRDLKTESDREGRGGATPLADALSETEPANLDAVPPARMFLRPEAAPRQPKKDETNIQYAKPAAQVDRVKRALGVRSARKAGSMTFDHYLRTECED